jgi:alanine dehydrogenase
VLAVLGAGQQAAHHVRAACEVRRFESLRIWNRSHARAEALAAALGDLGPSVEVVRDAAQAVAVADVVITVTASRSPLFPAAVVRDGTHLACMGADTRGKQEVEPALLRRAALYADVVAQALEFGECQHLGPDERAREGLVRSLGDLLTGRAAAYSTPSAITLYDGTGTGLQDLMLAERVLEALGP